MDIDQYGEFLKKMGVKVVNGSQKTLWVGHEHFSMQRQPVCALHVPPADEIETVLGRSRALLLDFVTKPTESHTANCWSYVCVDPQYSIERLAKGPRYDIRRGLGELEIRAAEQGEIRKLGLQAYCDARARNGLSDGTRDEFDAKLDGLQPATRFFGAFKDNQLAGFFSATEVEDWVSLSGYAADKFLSLRPNNALVYYVVHHYLVEKKLRLVSYGLSSVQAVSNAEGLHRFKVKMGFEAVPVHRVFVVNPLVRPLVNRGSWKLAASLLKLAPHNRTLKKAEGALRMALHESI